MAPPTPHSDLAAFHKLLLSSKRILALCGAGLSAASGLPTFRGAGGLWRNHQATDLATPGAFARDPGLVWLFYAYRRHMALRARPNRGHAALAALARRLPPGPTPGGGGGGGFLSLNPSGTGLEMVPGPAAAGGFLCLTQNVDGLSLRAGHPPGQLKAVHGSLFTLWCTRCAYTDAHNTADPLCAALAPAAEDVVDASRPLPLLDPAQPLAHIPAAELPHCPDCGVGLLRPGVVWFGEGLDEDMLRDVDAWVDAGPVDLMLVVGTSAVVMPAAGYIAEARRAGARVAVVNLEAETTGALAEMEEGDFAFGGDAAEVLPMLLEPLIGDLQNWDIEGEGEASAS